MHVSTIRNVTTRPEVITEPPKAVLERSVVLDVILSLVLTLLETDHF